MHHLIVRSFGPLSSCEVSLERLMVLIGPQSSGKSTISKLLFYFLHVRDEIVNYVLDQLDTGKRRIVERDLTKRLRRRFVEFWGPTPQPADLYIHYEYVPGVSLTIRLDDEKHRYITPRFSPDALRAIRAMYEDVLTSLGRDSSVPSMFSTPAALAAEHARTRIVAQVRERCNQLFGFDKDLLFIPAGRSLLSTLSDQLQYIHPHQLDYPMRLFIERVNSSKVFFAKSLDALISERQVLGSTPVWFSSVRRAESYVRRILRGEYVHDREGGRLYVNEKVYTKINYASSGQQEAVWILLSLFLAVLDRIRAVIFIEEPEAHLFPVAQKEIAEFIAFTMNAVDSDFVITTHSPYILAAFNNLLYAKALADTHAQQVERVIPRHLWLSASNVAGFLLSNGRLVDLLAPDLQMFQMELIDNASQEVDDIYDQLLDIERTESGK